MKYSRFAKALLVAGAILISQSATLAANNPNLAWTVTFLGSSYDAGQNQTTYSYDVCSVSEADWTAAGNRPSDLKNLSHWTLGFDPDCPEPEVTSSHQLAGLGPDGSIPENLYGFKWEVEEDKFDPVCRTYTITLPGFSEPVDGQYVVKAGADYAIRDIQVPGCPGTPPLSPPSISINNASGSECDGPLSFEICLSKVWTEDITVQYATADASATAGSDYTATSGTVTISAGDTCVTVQVGITDDGVTEGNETFVVNLSNPTNATIDDDQGEGTIENCDPEPTISINNASGSECDGPLSFQICLSKVWTEDITVQYATANGSATAGSDYTATSGTVTISAGDTCVTVQVGITDDGVTEGNETFVINLSNPTNATIDDDQGEGTIENCDPEPTISINNASGRECDGPLSFEICLSRVWTEDITVQYATADSSATAGSDYTATNGTVTISAGDTCVTVQVGITDDGVTEGNEAFVVNLSNPTNATIDDGQGEGTITDCDPPNIVIVDPELVTECDTTEIIFTVTLSEASNATITVDYATQDLTATAGADYVASAGTITFAPGETMKQLTITLTPDTIDESPEQFRVTLTNPVNGAITDATADATIQDCGDDPTAVELISFDAKVSANGGVVLSWETASEFDSAGFHVFRSQVAEDNVFEFDQITNGLIPSRGSTGEGASYTHADQPGYGRFIYQLEEMELDGHRERRGTVAVDLMPELSIERSSNGDAVIINFNTLPEWNYSVEYTDAIGERKWKPLPNARSEAGRVIDPSAPGKSVRIYRLKATPASN